MTGAREEILARLRAALTDRPQPVPAPRDYRRGLAGTPDVAELFAERVTDYRATVERATVARLPSTVAAALRARGVHRLVVPPGIPDGWLAEAGVEVLSDDPPLSVDQLDQADGVLTSAAAAIALTGTVILDAGPDQGRRALSLLPDYHLCVIRTDQIVATVPEAIARLDPRRPQTWISGPSATSDIELNRVEGVHGPRTLHLVIWD